MTKLFLAEYLQIAACNDCKRPRAANRKFCAQHLKRYRLQFQAWCHERRAAGRCISCQIAAVNEQLRCSKHRVINANRCRTWSADKRTQNRTTGVCWKHQIPVIVNTAWCTKCRNEQRIKQGRSPGIDLE